MNLKAFYNNQNRVSDSENADFYNQLTVVLDNLTVVDRREFLKTYLKGYAHVAMVSPSLGKVVLTKDGIEETAHHASKSVKSTMAAMQLRNVVETAVWDGETDTPKDGKQTKRFHFKEMYFLYTSLPFIGKVKLTIGRKGNNLYIEYCCTANIE